MIFPLLKILTDALQRREGSVLVNVEDTLRLHEDEVDAITFNLSVHNAMRKFARNQVLRKVKVTTILRIYLLASNIS